MSSILTKSSPSETLTPPSVYPRVAVDDPFIRHHKYFFEDGNVTLLVDGILYCVHRYYFSRESIYFSTRFSQLGARDHEAFPITISLSNIKSKDLDAFLSILYPEDFDQKDLCYEEWKSVLYLSTLWGFASIRRLALNSIQPPTPHDRLLLARTYSADHWVVPALSALCERGSALSLDEARQMNIEDVVVVATVREDIRNHTIQVDAAEIPRRVEAAQSGKLVQIDRVDVPSSVPASGTVEQASSHVDQKRASRDGDTDEGDGIVPEKQGASEDIGVTARTEAEELVEDSWEVPARPKELKAKKSARHKAEKEEAKRKAREKEAKHKAKVEAAKLKARQEESKRVEEEMRRVAEEMRRSEEGLRRVEEEMRRVEVEMRRVEEETRRVEEKMRCVGGEATNSLTEAQVQPQGKAESAIAAELLQELRYGKGGVFPPMKLY